MQKYLDISNDIQSLKEYISNASNETNKQLKLLENINKERLSIANFIVDQQKEIDMLKSENRDLKNRLKSEKKKTMKFLEKNQEVLLFKSIIEEIQNICNLDNKCVKRSRNE